MSWTVTNPPTLMIQTACDLYNTTSAAELPESAGHRGINDAVWGELIDLTKGKCGDLRIPMPGGDGLKGMCIWASVVAAKFYRHKFAYIDTHVVRVAASGDHYFVVAQNHVDTVICDITCNQFGGPDFFVGTLNEIKGASKKVMAGGSSLYDAYNLGASTKTYVI